MDVGRTNNEVFGAFNDRIKCYTYSEKKRHGANSRQKMKTQRCTFLLFVCKISVFRLYYS